MKKGQAALEFLTTYGWAFLVILVMIGALAYFGILSPSRFLPERCNVGPEFKCEEYLVSRSDGQLKIRFMNNVGEPIESIKVTNAKWAKEDLGLNPANCSVAYPGGGSSANPGDLINVTCDFDQARFPPTGAKIKFNVDMTYLPQGKTYAKSLTAEVYTTLQP